MTYPFSGVSIALAGDCKGDVLIRVSVPQGLISEASWVHLSFIPDMVLMCVCSNNLTLELSAAVFSSCLAAFLEVERRCGSDTTHLHFKQAYILLVARLIFSLPPTTHSHQTDFTTVCVKLLILKTYVK